MGRHPAIGSAIPSIPDPILSTVLVPRGCSCAAPVSFGVDVSAFSRRRGVRLKFGSPGGRWTGRGVYPGFSFDPYDPSLLRAVYTVCKRRAVWLLCVECIDRPSSDKLQYQGADIVWEHGTCCIPLAVTRYETIAAMICGGRRQKQEWAYCCRRSKVPFTESAQLGFSPGSMIPWLAALE